MKPKIKIAIVTAAVICLAIVLRMAIGGRGGLTKLTYSQFLEQLQAGQVASVVILGSNSGAQATCRLKNGNPARTVLPSDYRDAMVAMGDKRVNIEIQDSSTSTLRLFANAAPFFVLLGFWIILMMRKRRNGSGLGGLG